MTLLVRYYDLSHSKDDEIEAQNKGATCPMSNLCPRPHSGRGKIQPQDSQTPESLSQIQMYVGSVG